VQIGSGAVISGGLAVVGDGIVEIQGASNERVSFLSGGSGGLVLDDPRDYSGKVSGFGGSGHSNHTQFIDLASVISDASVSASFSNSMLTVTSGATVVAEIAFAGSYVSSNFHLGVDSGGHVEITDPPVANGSYSSNIALLGQYMAGSFATAAAGQGHTALGEAGQAADQQQTLVLPHHG
jgi:hypothetical protein